MAHLNPGRGRARAPSPSTVLILNMRRLGRAPLDRVHRPYRSVLSAHLHPRPISTQQCDRRAEPNLNPYPPRPSSTVRCNDRVAPLHPLLEPNTAVAPIDRTGPSAVNAPNAVNAQNDRNVTSAPIASNAHTLTHATYTPSPNCNNLLLRSRLFTTFVANSNGYRYTSITMRGYE